MKYQENSIVQIKSKEWYDYNKDKNGNITKDGLSFTSSHAKLCGQQVRILKAHSSSYSIYTSKLFIADWMIDIKKTDEYIERQTKIMKVATNNLADIREVPEEPTTQTVLPKKRGRKPKSETQLPNNYIKINPGDLVIGWSNNEIDKYCVGEYIDHKGKLTNIRVGDLIISVDSIVPYTPEKLSELHQKSSIKRMMTQDKIKLESTLWKHISDFQEKYNVKIKGKILPDGLEIKLV